MDKMNKQISVNQLFQILVSYVGNVIETVGIEGYFSKGAEEELLKKLE